MLLPGKIRVGRVGVLQLQRWFIVVDACIKVGGVLEKPKQLPSW